MDTALPLQRYRVFESHDLDEARENVARIFCPHRLSTLHPRDTLDACHHSALLHRDVRINYVQYGPAVHIDPGLLEDFFLLQIPLAGGAEIRCGTQVVEATARMASLPSPTERLTMRWADRSPHLIVKLSRAALLRQLEALMQAPPRGPLVFELGVPLEAPEVAPLVRYIEHLRATLDAGSTLQDHAMLAEQAEAYLMTSMLLMLRHNQSERLQAQRPMLLPRTVRRARELMASRADQPLSLAEICQHVGASARSVQQAFREHLGVSPLQWLRDLRLDRVRDELAAPGGADNVADIAARYGFVHLGHFAALYRARFGERPSETLARRRRAS